MTKQNFNLIKQMTKNYKPTGQKPIKTNKASLRESMIQICYELANTEEQMQILQEKNPQMYNFLKDKFQEIEPERENFVYFKMNQNKKEEKE